MAFNNGFPMTYQQMSYPQYQQPMYAQQAFQPPAQSNSRMVEIVPVDTEDMAVNFPVGAGQTQAMISKNDSFIAFKSVSMNGQTEFVVYDKRPPAPPEPVLNPKEYVRKDEVDTLISAAMLAFLDKHKEDNKE